MAPNFELRQDILLSLGGLSDAVAVDLNEDGLLDLVETDFFDRTVTFGMGDGLGDFATTGSVPIDGFPGKIAVGDFDADGTLDVAVTVVNQAITGEECADCDEPSVAVLQQDSSGVFHVTATIVVSVPPTDLVAGRLTGGPQDDLVVTLPNARQVWVLQMTAPGVLEVVSLLEDTAGQPLSVGLIDENHDGVLDLLLGEVGLGAAPDRVALYRGDAAEGPGNYDFASAVVAIAGGPVVRNAGDVNGDGFDDVSVAQFGTDTAQLLLGSATGLGAPITVDFGATQSTVMFRDLDGDGMAEAAAALFEEGTLMVITPSSPLDWAHGRVAYYNVGSFPRALDAPDFGGDGLPDLFCSNAGDLSIAFAKGGGEFRAARGYPLGSAPAMISTGDFDGNGTTDAVSIDVFQRTVVFMSGGGDGTFERMGSVLLEPSATETPGYLHAADFDGDGDLDIAATLFQAGQVQILRNGGSLPFPEPSASDRISVGSEPTGLTSGDVDGDGDIDLVVANSTGKSVQVLLGDGAGGFLPQPAIGLSFRTLAVHLVDLTGNGVLDLAVTTGDFDGTDANLFLFEGDGAGGFAVAAQVELDDVSADLASADFNRDGRMDLAAGQSTQDVTSVFVILNNGEFSFTSSSLFVGSDPGTLEVADVNRDGHLDLIVPLGIGELRLALGDGTGAFPTVIPLEVGQLPVPFGTSASAFRDVDGDGLEDLLLISGFTPYLWVGRNISTELTE